MNNPFYTCLCNQSATALSGVQGLDVVDRDFIPVKRHDSVEQLSDIVFGRQRDHQLMMYAMAKPAVVCRPVQLIYRVGTLDQGYPPGDLITYFWNTLTTPRTDGMQTLQFSGNYTTPLYQINRFTATFDGTHIVLTAPDGTQVTRILAQGPLDTAVPVLADRSVYLRVPHSLLPSTIVWASKPAEPYLHFFEQESLFIGALGDQVIDQPSCFTASDLKTLRAQLVSADFVEALAAAATIIAGHTAHLAAISL